MTDASSTSDAALLAMLRLSLVDGIGPRLSQALLDRFTTAEAVFEASENDLRSVEGIGPKLATSIRRAVNEVDPQREVDLAREHGARLLMRGGAGYPTMLAAIHDPPLVLYVHGTILPQDAVAVAIV